jgi:hypothetical protein
MLPLDGATKLMSLPRTNAAVTFSWEMLQLGELSAFIEQTASDYDQFYEGAAKVILSFPDADKKLGPFTLAGLRSAAAEGSGKRDKLKDLEQLQLQMAYARAVDDFLTYLSDLVSLIFKTRPETLSSSEQQVPIAKILQYGTKDELIAALTEERVNALAYQGMTQLDADLKKRLKFDLFERKEDSVEAVRIVEIRNLIVHNRAIVNNTFINRLDRVGIKGYTVGQGITLHPSIVRSEASFLFERVLDMDHRAIEKFGLPTVPHTGK